MALHPTEALRQRKNEMMNDVIPLTPLGFQLLRKKKTEYEETLLGSRDRLAVMAQGSPDEGFQDSFVLQLQMDAQIIERQLRELDDLLRRARPQTRPEATEALCLGHRALLKLEYPWQESETLAVVLVASQELPLLERYLNDGEAPVSVHSPLGKALYGARQGDSFSYEIDGGKVHGKVLSVEVWAPAFDVTDVTA